MPMIAWLETFEIGIDEIDNDHKEILEIASSIEERVGKEADISSAVANLIHKIKEHFRKEEKILTHFRYPEIDSHKKYHKQLLRKANKLKNICGERDVSGEYCESAITFIIDDFVKDDMNFKSYLEYHGFARRVPEVVWLAAATRRHHSDHRSDC
jgi:hemerythrin